MADLAIPSTVPALITRQARIRGEHPAICTVDETVSYAELDRRSSRFARALLAAGVGKGTRVALLAPDGVFWVTAFLGALRAGALVSTVSTLCAPPELAQILIDSDCQHLIATRRFLNHDYAATLERALPDLKAQDATNLRTTHAPYLRHIWLDDCSGLGWARPIDELEAGAADIPAALLLGVEREVGASDEAVIVYTSGSTAQPKAVVHRQWTLARHPPELARQFALTPDDRMMCLLPSFWLAGLSMTLQVLSVGAALVYPASPSIKDALTALTRLKVTRVNAWGDKQPQLIQAAVERGMDIAHIPDLAGFRDASGAPVPDRIAMYGMTESFSAHSAHPLDAPLPPGKEAAFGRAINGYERRVVNPETGSAVVPGQAGELQIRGPAMLAGLYKRLPRDVFTADGFYPTRDLVRIDAEGWLYPEGRIDDMIKTRGANVSRLEVEAALKAIAGVEQAIVAGLADPAMGMTIAAAVVAAPRAELDETTLQGALRHQLSSYKVPRRIVFIDPGEVPRTATGKVRLSEIAALIAARL